MPKETAPKETVCGLYTRVSSRNQLEPEYNSLVTQKERLEAYCKAQDYRIHKVYEDGAYSGDSMNRPALNQMLADIRAGIINCVVTYKIDRLTRNVKDFHTLIDIFESHGATYVSVTQNLDTKTPTGRLMRNILLDFAQFEREMTSDRTRDKMHQRAQKGLWNGGQLPYGYINLDKKLLPEAGQAPRLRFMFEYFAERPSLSGLQAALKAKGWKNRRGALWSKTGLARILSNPLYCGKIRLGEKVFPGEHPALVDEALFQRCQAQEPRRSHREPFKGKMVRVFPLRGLVHCGVCGSFMTPHYTQKVRRSDGYTYQIPYYRCTKTMHLDNTVCTIKAINAVHLEGMVVQGLDSLAGDEAVVQRTISDLNANLIAQNGPAQDELKDAEQRLREIEDELDRYVQAVGKGTLSVARLEKRMAALEDEKKGLLVTQEALLRKLAESETRAFDAALVERTLRDFRKTYKHLPQGEQAETLQSVLKGVLVHADRVELDVFEHPDLLPLGSKERDVWLLELDSNQQPFD